MASTPTKSATGKHPPKGREDRLKVALKANMARRKAQARARAETDAGTDEPRAKNQAGQPAKDE